MNDEFIITDVVDVPHNALASTKAQIEITDVKLAVSELDVIIDIVKKMIHIVKAVNITIFDNFNKLVADAIIPKYFSRDVYYEIDCTNGLMLSYMASSSYEGSDSLV